MLDVDITVRNFRCFGDEPVSLRMRDGFTALVGVNNSGKSSLLRLLYEFRPILSEFRVGMGNGHPADRLLRAARETMPTFNVLAGERVHRAGVDRDVELTFTVHDGPKGALHDAGRVLGYRFSIGKNGGVSSEVMRDSQVIADPDKPVNVNVRSDFFDPFLAAMECLSDTMYVGPFRNAINLGAGEQYFDIQIGGGFVRQFAEFKSGADPAANEAVVELTEEIRGIFGLRSLEINASADRKNLQVTVDGRSYRLTEQGAGLAHFIVVLVNVMVRRPYFLLIDEPELNLHASLQSDFLTTLAKYTRGGVVFATHSLGLARTVADDVLVVAKDADGTRRVQPYEADKDLVTLLGQLSFERRPELGFSKILLVEGKTEIRALMQILRLYGKEHEVLCLPLHGGEMIRGDVQQELADIQRIGGTVSYLIDSERNSGEAPLSRNRAGFVAVCEGLGMKGLVLRRRALENYFTQAALDRTFDGRFRELEPYEKKAGAQGWAKTENWRIAAHLTRADLDGTDLGDFLAGL